jgi:hypothetical protein
MANRRGVVYIAVLILSVVGIIGGMAYHQMMQVGRRAAYRSLTGEYAGMMARTGLSLAQGYLARSMRQKGSPLYALVTKPLADLTAQGPVVKGPEIDLIAEFPQLVGEMAQDLPDGVRSLTRLAVTFYLLTDQLKALPALPLADKTFARDGPEKSGRLYASVEAEIANPGLGLGGGLVRELRGYVEFRVAHAPVPLLSDFTLFVQKKLPPNGLDANEVGIATGTDGIPIVLANGAPPKVQVQVADDMNLDFFKKQGWVFLGGGEVTLNLTYSQDETAGDRSVGEDFHFYQYNPSNRSAGRTVVDRDPDTVNRANKHLNASQPFWEIRYWDMGVNPMRSGPLKDEYEDVFAGVPQDQKKGSLLKLFGASPDRVSPTVVLGDVQAGYLRIALAAAANNANGAYDAYFAVLVHKPKNSSGFLSGFFTKLIALAGALLFNDDPKLSGKWVFFKPDITNVLMPFGSGAKEVDYKELCSGYRTRNYNRALLHLKAKNRKSNPDNEQTGLGLPDSVIKDGTLPQDRSKLPAELLPPELAPLAGLDLGAVDLALLADPLAKASCLKLPAGKDLAAFLTENGMLNGGVLDLGTLVRAEGPVTVPAITQIVRGGVILAKAITLAGAVNAGPAAAAGDPQRKLVLVATEGAVQLPQNGKVDASLVALKGAVAPQGDFEVSGNVVASTLDLGPLASGVGAADLKYDPALKQRAAEAAADGQLLVDWSRRWVRVD